MVDVECAQYMCIGIVVCDVDRCVWRAWCALGVRDVNTCVFVCV